MYLSVQHAPNGYGVIVQAVIAKYVMQNYATGLLTLVSNPAGAFGFCRRPITKEYTMTSKAIGSICAALAATMIVSAPVAARPNPHHGKKQVCKFERHGHGKSVKVCRWVRR